EVPQYLGTDTIIPMIGFKTELQIGVYRVQAVFLEVICVKLVNQANAPSFLVHIDDHALTFLFNHLHRTVQLGPTVAPARSKNIAGYTGTMYAHQNGFIGLPFAFVECYVLLTRVFLCIGSKVELPPFGG